MTPAYDLERVVAAAEQLQSAIAAAQLHTWPDALTGEMAATYAALMRLASAIRAEQGLTQRHKDTETRRES